MRDVNIDDLQQMIDMDGQARGLFNALRLPIIKNAQAAEIKPYKPGVGLDEAEFIRSNFFDPRPKGGMTVPFSKIVAHQTMAMLHGFKAFERVLDRPGTVVDDGKTRLRKLAPRDSRYITFKTDDHGGFDGFVLRTQWKNNFIEKDIKRSQAIYYTVNEEENKFYGKSYFKPSYFHYDKKHKIYFITHMALAVGAIPPRLAEEPPMASNADKQKFLDALANLGTNSAMLVPSGYKILEQQFSSNGASLPYMDMINHHNTQMSKALLANIVDMGIDTSGGGFAIGKNDLDMLIMRIEYDAQEQMEMFNRYVIPELIDINFGTGNYPRVVMPPFSTDLKNLTKDVFSTLMTSRTIHSSAEFLAQMEKKMGEILNMDLNPVEVDAAAQKLLEIQEKQAEADLKKTLEPPAPVVKPGAKPASKKKSSSSPSVRAIQAAERILDEARAVLKSGSRNPEDYEDIEEEDYALARSLFA